MKKIFLLGGMSECGKSTAGRYLDSRGVRRLKFVTYLKAVMAKDGATGDFQEWNDRREQEARIWLWKRFIEEFKIALDQDNVSACCVESLYNPEFGEYIKTAFLPGEVVIVYVDIPLEIRLQRQIGREGLASIQEAKDMLLPRDAKKEAWGTPKIKDIADVVLDNSGSVDDLQRQIDVMLKYYGI